MVCRIFSLYLYLHLQISLFVFHGTFGALSIVRTVHIRRLMNDSFIVKDRLEKNGESHEYSIRTRTTGDKRAELTTASRIVVYCFF